eukprot:1765785-Pyramimonas_sp.AAC.1
MSARGADAAQAGSNRARGAETARTLRGDGGRKWDSGRPGTRSWPREADEIEGARPAPLNCCTWRFNRRD